MKITVLGSGLTATSPKLDYRYPSAHLVETNDHKLLLDSGIGVLPQLAKLGLEITDIDTICISHYHADHFNIEPLLQACYVLARATGNKASLHIIGPPDIEDRVKSSYKLRGWNYDDDLSEYVDVRFSAYNGIKSINLSDGLCIIPFKTEHFEFEAYALRLESEQKVVAYSGDSAATKQLETAANGADIFLCEAAIDIRGTPNNGHLSPAQAGKVARSANSKQLVLVHYSGFDRPEDMINDALASGYSGKVKVANDLDEYVI